MTEFIGSHKMMIFSWKSKWLLGWSCCRNIDGKM